ncbi:MAG: hypothetical protein KDK66_01510, partial [Deltaproteobacteria bacterium]|nr:hypothetical protein [Deltaproteobacteria bacterium]
RLAKWLLSRGRVHTNPMQGQGALAKPRQAKAQEGALVPTSPNALAVPSARGGSPASSPNALAKMGVGTEGAEASQEAKAQAEATSEAPQAVSIKWEILINGVKPEPQDPDYHPSYRFNGYLVPEEQRSQALQDTESIYNRTWRIQEINGNQALLTSHYQGKIYQAKIQVQSNPDLGRLSDYQVDQVVALLPGVQGGLGANLEDITPEMAQAYYGGEEIFDTQMSSVRQSSEIRHFRQLRDRFIKLASQLEDPKTARFLAWMEELNFHFPQEDKEDLMDKVDMSDQAAIIEIMANGASAFPLPSQEEQSRSQFLAELADISSLSYYDLVYYADRYVYLATCSLGECSEEYQALNTATKHFPGILMEPDFKELDIEILSNRWATGHHPLYLLRSHEEEAKIDGEWMNIPEAYQHDWEHTYVKATEDPNHHLHLSHRIEEMESRLNFLAFTETQTWVQAKLLEIFWFEGHHDNSDRYSNKTYFFNELLEPFQEALKGPQATWEPQQSLGEINRVWRERDGLITEREPYIILITELCSPNSPYHRYLKSRDIDPEAITAQELLEAFETFEEWIED